MLEILECYNKKGEGQNCCILSVGDTFILTLSAYEAQDSSSQALATAASTNLPPAQNQR